MIAVFIMMCMANAARSAGATTRRMGSVSRSCLRRFSRSSTSSDADRGVSTKPGAIRLTLMGASSRAKLAVRAGRGRDGRGDSEADAWMVAARTTHEQKRASRPHLAGVARDLDHQQHVLIERAARLFEVHVDDAAIVRPASRYHYVLDGPWQGGKNRSTAGARDPDR